MTVHSALAAEPQADSEFRDQLAVLSLPLPKGRSSSPEAEQWWGKTYQLENSDLKFETVAIKFVYEQTTLLVGDERGEHSIQIGEGTWRKGTTDLRGSSYEPVAACGAWTAKSTYEVRVCYYESEFCPVFRFHYTGDKLKLEVEPNVSWGTPMVTAITGRS